MADPITSFSDTEFITQELKKQNKGLYLCSLYFEDHRQFAAQNIFSLFLELKKIPSTISEPMLGEIRTTWWREMIEAGDPENIGAPLARQILAVIERFSLNKNLFYDLIEGFTSDLYKETYPTQKELDQFFDQTYGSYFAILHQLCSDHTGSDAAMKFAGRALGTATTLYETPIALQRNQHYFPQEMLADHSMSSEDVFERIYSSSQAQLVGEVTKSSLEWLKTANEKIKLIENQTKPAFTPLAQIKPMLNMVRKTVNPLTQITPLNPLSFQWHLWKCARRGQF